MLGALVAIVVVLVLAVVGGGSDEPVEADTPTLSTEVPEVDFAQQLQAAGYNKVKSTKQPNAEAGRDVVTEWWARDRAPEEVIITDGSTYTEAGKLVVNAINYRGTDGNGNMSCQPDPEHIRSDLADLIGDADKVRAGVKDGSLKANPDHPSDFPYQGEFMLCRS